MGPLGKGRSFRPNFGAISSDIESATYVSLNKLLGVMKPVFRSLLVVHSLR